jgi:putative flippase GtrA
MSCVRSQLVAHWSKFGVVGGLGFLTEAAILQLLLVLGIAGPIAGRFISFPVAVTLTWALNRQVTFGKRPKGESGRRYFFYVIGQVIAALANFATYAGLLFVVPRLARLPTVALAGGAAVGMVFNFWWADRVVFKGILSKGGQSS